MLFTADKPPHLPWRDPVLMFEDSSRPYRHCDLIFGNADFSANQVLGLANPRFGVHVDAGVAKSARGKDRNRNKIREPPVAREQIGTEGHLGGIELLIAEHAPEGLLHAQRQIG